MFLPTRMSTEALAPPKGPRRTTNDGRPPPSSTASTASCASEDRRAKPRGRGLGGPGPLAQRPLNRWCRRCWNSPSSALTLVYSTAQPRQRQLWQNGRDASDSARQLRCYAHRRGAVWAIAGRQRHVAPPRSVRHEGPRPFVHCGESTSVTQSPWTAIVSEEDGWWIGWIAEVPGVNAQERTREALLDTLAEVLREALEMNRQDALATPNMPMKRSRSRSNRASRARRCPSRCRFLVGLVMAFRR